MQRPTHLTPAPLLPVAEGGIGWGPFGGAVPRRASGDPRAAARASSHDVIVFTACVALVLFLVLGVAVGGAPRDVDVSSASAPREYRAGGGRKLTQFLAPVWYALPGLRDSLYNLVRRKRALGRRLVFPLSELLFFPVARRRLFTYDSITRTISSTTVPRGRGVDGLHDDTVRRRGLALSTGTTCCV